MHTSTIPLLPEIDVPTIERVKIGTVVHIVVHGVVVHQFGEKDSTGRAVAIASLLRLQLTTDVIASLCGASHGWVCRVRKRLRAGGIDEVVAKRRSGRPRAIQGAMRATLVRMMAEGARCTHIARVLGVAGSVVHGEMARVRQEQTEQLSIVQGAASVPKPPTPDAESMSELVVEADDGVPADDDVRPLEIADETVPASDEELVPGALLPSGPTEHPTRYAGVLLVAGALAAIGMQQALASSRVARPKAAIYEATTVLFAMMAG